MRRDELKALDDDTFVVMSARNLKSIVRVVALLYEERRRDGDSQRNMAHALNAVIDNSFELPTPNEEAS